MKVYMICRNDSVTRKIMSCIKSSINTCHVRFFPGMDFVQINFNAVLPDLIIFHFRQNFHELYSLFRIMENAPEWPAIIVTYTENGNKFLSGMLAKYNVESEKSIFQISDLDRLKRTISRICRLYGSK